MINLKKILQESNAPGFKDRKFGDALPTLASVQAAYQAKQSALSEDTYDTEEEEIDEAKSLKQYTDKQLIAMHKGQGEYHGSGPLLKAIEQELKKRKVKVEAAPKMKKNKEAAAIQDLMNRVASAQKGGGSGRYGKEFDKAKTKALRAMKDMVEYSKIGA